MVLSDWVGTLTVIPVLLLLVGKREDDLLVIMDDFLCDLLSLTGWHSTSSLESREAERVLALANGFELGSH